MAQDKGKRMSAEASMEYMYNSMETALNYDFFKYEPYPTAAERAEDEKERKMERLRALLDNTHNPRVEAILRAAGVLGDDDPGLLGPNYPLAPKESERESEEQEMVRFHGWLRKAYNSPHVDILLRAASVFDYDGDVGLYGTKKETEKDGKEKDEAAGPSKPAEETEELWFNHGRATQNGEKR